MPNTLCHIALQAPLTGIIFPRRLLIWALAGCIIPDVPWVSLKLLLFLDYFNPYDLRLYFTAQASLFFSLLLTATLSMFVYNSREAVIVAGGNCVLHLFFDALQIKWGNGVHLLAPFDWKMYRLELLWPEHGIVTTCTLFGLIYFLVMWKPICNDLRKTTSFLNFSNNTKHIAGLIFCLAYLLGPLPFFDAMQQSDTYYINTMRHVDKRPGKSIVFDRAHYRVATKEIRIYTGELFKIVGPQPTESGRVSLQGIFVAPNTVFSKSFHYHRDFRDWASITGLFLTCTLLFQSLVLPGIRNRQP